MAAPALLDVLRDFGTQPPFIAVRAEQASVAQHSEFATPPPPPPAPDPAIIRAAVEEAEAALAARLREEHAAAVADLEARHEAELARLSEEVAAELFARCSTRLAEAEARLTELTTASVARMLGAALSDDIVRRAIGELAENIAAALGDAEAVRIKVRGPASLYEALKPALGRHAEQAEFTEAPGLDLTVSIDESLFETRISAWSASLAELVD